MADLLHPNQATNGFSITPADGKTFVHPNPNPNVATVNCSTNWLVVSVSGNVAVHFTGAPAGQTVVFYATAGLPYYVRVDQVYATGTTATGIVGFI